MTKKKQKEKSWFDDHLIIDIDGVSKKEKEAIKQRIIERVVEKFDKQERKTKWLTKENTHPNKIDDYIEADPDNPHGTRNTERGRELFDELEEFVRNTLWVIYKTKN